MVGGEIGLMRIDHIAIVVEDLAAQSQLLQELFGFRPAGEAFECGMPEGARFLAQRFDVPGRSGLGFEVLTPTSSDGSFRGGFHHMALQVADLEAAEAALRARGDELARYDLRPAGSTGSVAYLEPEACGQGVRWELCQGPMWPHPTFEAPTGSIGIDCLDSVAHASADREALTTWYSEVMGLRPYQIVEGRFVEGRVPPRQPLQRLALPDGQVGSSPFETPGISALSPLRPDSPAGRLLASGRMPISNVYWHVRDFDEAAAALARRGIELTDDHQLVWEWCGPLRAGGIAARNAGITMRFWQQGYAGGAADD